MSNSLFINEHFIENFYKKSKNKIHFKVQPANSKVKIII